MKVNEGLSVLFWLCRSKANNDGMMPIYIRITVNGGRDVFSSGKKILPDYWNEEIGMAVKACPDQKSINAYVQQTTKDIEKHYDRLKGVFRRCNFRNAAALQNSPLTWEVPELCVCPDFVIQSITITK